MEKITESNKQLGQEPFVNIINAKGDGGYIVPEKYMYLFVEPKKGAESRLNNA